MFGASVASDNPSGHYLRLLIAAIQNLVLKMANWQFASEEQNLVLQLHGQRD